MSNIKKIKLFWWRGSNFTNFGDEMNPHIVTYVSGRKVVKAEPHNAELFAIGSVLHRTQEMKCIAFKKLVSNNFHIWGTGTLEPIHLRDENILDITLVRGPLTASLLKKTENQLKFGDPGLLVSEVWKVKKEKKYKWGLIVHHTQYKKEWVEKLLKMDNVVFIDIKDPDIKNIMEKINQCEFIASSSLHGLIVADSYQIPNFWLWDDNLHRGGEWKFLDYFLSVKRNFYEKYNPNLIKSLDDIIIVDAHDYLKDIDNVKDIIFNSFPKDLI